MFGVMMFKKQKIFYTPLLSDRVIIQDDFKSTLIDNIYAYRQEDLKQKENAERVMSDGRKGYYTNSLTVDTCPIEELTQLVLALENKIQQEMDEELCVRDFGFVINPKGTYQTIVNNSDVEFNGHYILQCGDDAGIHNGEVRLLNPNTYTKPIYQSVLAIESMFYVWPGSVMWEQLPSLNPTDRITVQLYIERNK
jgi:hypothetical protein